MTYDELKTEFERRIQPLKLSDMADLNKKCSEILGELVSENVLEIDDISESCKKILREYYERMNETNVRIQKELDEKNGLKIAPQKADFPSERVAQIAKSLTDPTVPPETIQRRARSAIENVANSFHDDYVRENAKFRSKAGIRCYIVRETDGNCCAWCSSLAGRYIYGNEPDDIFRRHDNCTCMVTFENGRERQNVWSENKWQVSKILKVPYKPLVLDKNQAENLQNIQLAKHKGLDKSDENDIIELKRFERSQEALPEKYISALQNKYNNGTDIARKIYDKFVPVGGAVADMNSVKAYHSYRTHKVYLNVSKDTINPRGEGTTWFHEHGHYIDHENGYISHSKSFLKHLKNDVKTYEKSYMRQYNLSNIKEARKQIADEFNQNHYLSHSIQDIFGGIYKKRYRADLYGHNTSYWIKSGKYGVCREAFAHMFEASFDLNKQMLMRQYLPNAWEEFQKLLGGII